MVFSVLKAAPSSSTYSVDAVQLLRWVEQHDGEDLPAQAAITEELPRFLCRETLQVVLLLDDILPFLIPVTAMQLPQGWRKTYDALWFVGVLSTHDSLHIWSGCKYPFLVCLFFSWNSASSHISKMKNEQHHMLDPPKPWGQDDKVSQEPFKSVGSIKASMSETGQCWQATFFRSLLFSAVD